MIRTLPSPYHIPRIIGVLRNADFNVTTDQLISIGLSSYIVSSILVHTPSINLTTAAGGIYTAASKGGSAIVANTQVYTALTSSLKYLYLTLASAALVNKQSTSLYFSLTTPQGAAATASIFVYGIPVPT